MPNHHNEKISELFQRIEERRVDHKNALPKPLTELIKKADLKEIYSYLIENQEKIEKALAKGKPCRLDKKTTHLARTLNFIIDPITKDIILILETKRKIASNRKNLKTKTFSGSFKTTKVAWRIDSEIPKKMANAVYYVDKNASLSDAQKEAMAAQKVVNANSGVDCYINVPALGPVIAKAGIRQKDKVKYSKKQSFYAMWASGGSLDHFMESDEFKSLNTQQLDIMATQLLTSLVKLHQSGMIHQDIKPDNILVFKNESGEYRLELADFGKVYVNGGKVSGNSDVHATPQYDSPEIAALNKKPSASDHTHYYNNAKPSYGRDFGQYMNSVPEYALPHTANDMWSIGIVLHELYFKTKPQVNQKTKFTPLIAGLLQPNRAERSTAEEALSQLTQSVKKTVKKTVKASAKRKISTEQQTPVKLNPGFNPMFKSTGANLKEKVVLRKSPRNQTQVASIIPCVKRKRFA